MRLGVPLLVLAIILAASAAAADEGPCPPEPPHTVAITVLSSSQRSDLTRAVATGALQLAEHAGFTVITNPSTGRSVTMASPACVPTLVVSISTGVPQAFMASATWYFEPVVANATLALPDGRVRRAGHTETARWFGDYPRSYTPDPPAADVSVDPSRRQAEQAAAQRGTTVTVQRLLAAINQPSR